MKRWFLAMILAAAAAASEAQVPVRPPGEELAALAARDALVTVVIQSASGPREIPNLRMAGVHGTHITVVDSNGDILPLLFEDVIFVRVQDEEVHRRAFVPQTILTKQQQAILEHARERVRALFRQEGLHAALRNRAATLLAAAGDTEARAWLLRAARDESVEAALDAAMGLHLIGDPAAVPHAPFPAMDALADDLAGEPSVSAPLLPELLVRGLNHGNREVRAHAALLAGLAGAESLIPELSRQMNDRVPELAVPAAKAMANLGQKAAIPRLLDLLMERTPAKGEAALYGLEMLGNGETREALKRLVPAAHGHNKLRLGQILFTLGDPMGREMLVDIMRGMPTIAGDAALVLANGKDGAAIQAMRDRLKKRENPTPENLHFRARAAAALYRAGDPAGISHLAELLRRNEPDVIHSVCALFVELGDTALIEVLQGPLESSQPGVVLDAASAVTALADDDFRSRLHRYQESQ